MNILNIAPVAEALETAAVYGARAYVLGGEIFTIGSILWVLSFMGRLIEGTYVTGEKVGNFYFTYVHEHATKVALASVAFVILIAQLAYEGAVLVYNNREEIGNNIVTGWHNIERAFCYQSPAVATA